jgi:LEA14-like dessication related protein
VDHRQALSARIPALPTTSRRRALLGLAATAALLAAGCAALQRPQPVEVILVGVEPLKSEGLELRMLVKLRAQNPNDSAIDYDGISVRLDLQGKPFATGVSGASGSVPRFGEAILEVPVSISVFRIARQAIGVAAKEFRGKLAYELSGQLAGPALGSVRFSSSGELTLPAELLEGRR